MEPVVIVLVVLVVLVVAAALWAVSAYNGFVRSRHAIEESWRQVEVELQRRHDLVPALVDVVKAAAGHEEGTLTAVTARRNEATALTDGPGADRAEAEERLTGAVHQLLATVEQSPELKANQNFLDLQRQLAESEDRIAAGRRYYNANVRVFNIGIDAIPTNLVAQAGKFEKASSFEVTNPGERQAPAIAPTEPESVPAEVEAAARPEELPGPHVGERPGNPGGDSLR